MNTNIDVQHIQFFRTAGAPSKLSSHQLFARAKEQDHQAQLELRKILLPRIRATCQRMLDDAIRSEEVAEDIFMDFIYKYIHNVTEVEALTSYLRMMTVRRCLRLRDLDRRHLPLEVGCSIPDCEKDLTTELDSERFHEQLNACLAQLDRRSSEVLRLRYYHKLTLEEIGVKHKITKQYVGQIIKRCLHKLKCCLKMRLS